MHLGLTLLLVPMVAGYKSGAPYTSCVDLDFEHQSGGFFSVPVPYDKYNLTMEEMETGDYLVTLTREQETKELNSMDIFFNILGFREVVDQNADERIPRINGILIQVRDVDFELKTPIPMGYFLGNASANIKTMQCTHEGDSITQTDNLYVFQVEALWRPNPNHARQVYATATSVESIFSGVVKIKSDPVVLRGNSQFSFSNIGLDTFYKESTTTTTTSNKEIEVSNEASSGHPTTLKFERNESTTKLPGTPTAASSRNESNTTESTTMSRASPMRAFVPVSAAANCRQSENCLTYPTDCTSSNDCISIVKWESAQGSLILDMTMSRSDGRYIASGFSSDQNMGEDLVVVCAYKDGEIIGETTWNRNKIGVGDFNEKVHVSAVQYVEASNNDGILNCQIEVNLKNPIHIETSFEPHQLDFSERLYVLLATGTYNGKVTYHKNQKSSSRFRYYFKDSGDRVSASLLLMLMSSAFTLILWSH